MEIARQKIGDTTRFRLEGRLDANWCGHVQNALAAAVRDGEHRIQADLSGVGYVSSAGLRVLLATYKQLKGIGGSFGVIHPSAAVRDVLDLAGLGLLIAVAATGEGGASAAERTHASPSARYELFGVAADGAGLRLRPVGNPRAWLEAGGSDAPAATRFGREAFALGIGALGGNADDCAARYGEFLAVAGAAAFQPTDGSSQPDFVISQDALVPEGRLLAGLAGEGSFPLLARFEATAEARTVGLTELARAALELGGAAGTAFVALTETSGLVGASLRRSPAAAAGGDRGAFPQVRDWLSFTSERAFRDSTSLLAGVVAPPDSALAPFLRPLGRAADLQAHVHAAAFPYRPLRKGRIELAPVVHDLFDGQALQAVLHLLADSREASGAGESEFFRGALWIAPLRP